MRLTDSIQTCYAVVREGYREDGVRGVIYASALSAICAFDNSLGKMYIRAPASRADVALAEAVRERLHGRQAAVTAGIGQKHLPAYARAVITPKD
jgi:hypothetical protein